MSGSLFEQKYFMPLTEATWNSKQSNKPVGISSTIYVYSPQLSMMQIALFPSQILQVFLNMVLEAYLRVLLPYDLTKY